MLTDLSPVAFGFGGALAGSIGIALLALALAGLNSLF